MRLASNFFLFLFLFCAPVLIEIFAPPFKEKWQKYKFLPLFILFCYLRLRGRLFMSLYAAIHNIPVINHNPVWDMSLV